MRRDDFTAAQQQHIVRAERGYDAFMPPDLPPDVELDAALIRRLSDADRAIGELSGLVTGLPNPALLVRTQMRREAVLSSRIEGTRASLPELALFELEPSAAEAQTPDVREVHNYLKALGHVLAADRRLPVSLSLLREAHDLLLTDTRRAHATPGEFRKSQNWIGPAGTTLDTATYVPPPPERLWDCLDSFEKFLHADGDLPLLLAIAAIHYQFEAIHPYVDGNGRVGRLLVSLLMVEWGLLPEPVLDLSAYIEPRRDDYYGALMDVSTKGDWTGWFVYFLDAIVHQGRDALARARLLRAMRERMRTTVSTGRRSAAAGKLVDALFELPVLTIPHARDLLNVTHRAATQNVEWLVELGILEEDTDPPPRRLRIFFAPQLIDALRSIETPRSPD